MIQEIINEQMQPMNKVNPATFNTYGGSFLDTILGTRALAYCDYAGVFKATTTLKKVPLMVADHDEGSDFTLDVRSTATAGTTGTDLYDSSAPFVEGDVGKNVWNLTDGGMTTIASYVSASQVTLTADIDLDATDEYAFGNSRFTVPANGVYLLTGGFASSIFTVSKLLGVSLNKNGTSLVNAYNSGGLTSYLSGNVASILELTTSDYIELSASNGNTNCNILNGKANTFISVIRLR